MIALDDAAWAAPWRHVRVGQKVMLSLGLMATALIAPPWPATVLVVIAAVTLTLGFAKIPPRTLALAFAAPAAFIIIGAISVSIQLGYSPPSYLYKLGPLSISQQSLTNAITVFARSCSATLSVLLLATTTPMADLLSWLRRLGVPGTLIEIASLMYRILFVLLDSAIAIHQAQVARLGDAPLGQNRLRRKFDNTGKAVGTLALRSWTRAQRLTDGLEARGITGDLVILTRQPQFSTRWLYSTIGLISGIWAASGLWVLIGARLA